MEGKDKGMEKGKAKYDKLFEKLTACNGTGKISRPLTEDEKYFLVCQIVTEIEGGRDIKLPNNAKVEVEK